MSLYKIQTISIVCRMDRLLSPNKDILPTDGATPRYTSSAEVGAPLSQLQNLSTYNASLMLQQATQTSSPRLYPQTTQTMSTSTHQRTAQTDPASPSGFTQVILSSHLHRLLNIRLKCRLNE